MKRTKKMSTNVFISLSVDLVSTDQDCKLRPKNIINIVYTNFKINFESN